MSNITYVSLSQATALKRSLNMTAHNLANASTAGYKSSHPLFASVDDNSTDRGISYVQDNGTYLELAEGALVPTGNPLDIGLRGQGWLTFALKSGETGYSRHGQLVLDAEGQLMTARGDVLLDASGGPISLPDGVGQNVIITSDGTITDQQGTVLGAIGVVTIEQGAKMLPLGGGMYSIPRNTAAPQLAENPKVMQGFVETSNVEAVLEMTRLIDIQRAYENAVKLMNQDDDLTKKAIQRLGTQR